MPKKGEIEKGLDRESVRPTKYIEKIFLDYANSSPGKDPRSLALIFKAGESFLEILDPSRNDLYTVIEQIGRLSSMEPSAAKKASKGKSSAPFLRIAYLSAYGWQEKKGACGDCYPEMAIIPVMDRTPEGAKLPDSKKLYRQTYLGEYLTKKPEERKCYECDHLFFVQMLKELVAGKPYSEICSSALVNLFGEAYRPLCEVVKVATLPELPIREYVYKGLSWSVQEAFDVEKGYELKEPFSGFNKNVLDLAGYSLAEFLIHNDRRRLKSCSLCGRFFVSDDRRQKKCSSEECRKEYERRKKRSQRDMDPVKYF